MGESIAVPPLAEFLRWMREMPVAFQEEPEGLPKGRLQVAAVVADLFETLQGERPDAGFLGCFRPSGDQARERNRLRWVLVACHLLWHPAFRAATGEDRVAAGAALRKLFVQELAALASVAPADGLYHEDERREELVRRALGALGLRFPGETEREARDRLAQVDSIERRRLMIEVARRQKKLRIEEALRRKAAEEAASKVARE